MVLWLEIENLKMQGSESNMKIKKRCVNWTKEEKDIFIEIMRSSAGIIEDKRTDSNTNKKKQVEWRIVKDRLKELGGIEREVEQLKGVWKRWKLTAKKNLSTHKRAMRATGGGPQPHSPSAEDLVIQELCPTDFVVETNTYDSDAVLERAQSPALQEMQIEELEEEFTNNESYINFEEQPDELMSDTITTPVQVASLQNSQTPKRVSKKKLPKALNHKSLIIKANTEVKDLQKQIMMEEHDMKMSILKTELQIKQNQLKNELLKSSLEIEILQKALED